MFMVIIYSIYNWRINNQFKTPYYTPHQWNEALFPKSIFNRIFLFRMEPELKSISRLFSSSSSIEENVVGLFLTSAFLNKYENLFANRTIPLYQTVLSNAISNIDLILLSKLIRSVSKKDDSNSQFAANLKIRCAVGVLKAVAKFPQQIWRLEFCLDSIISLAFSRKDKFEEIVPIIVSMSLAAVSTSDLEKCIDLLFFRAQEDKVTDICGVLSICCHILLSYSPIKEESSGKLMTQREESKHYTLSLSQRSSDILRSLIVQGVHGGAETASRDDVLMFIPIFLSHLSPSWTSEDCNDVTSDARVVNLGQFAKLLCSVVQGEIHLLLEEASYFEESMRSADYVRVDAEIKRQQVLVL